MKKIFSLISNAIVLSIVLTGNTFYDITLGGIIAVIVYIYAFKIVASMNVLRNKYVMSLSHWFLRTIASIIIILVVRYFYYYLNVTLSNYNIKNSDLISVIICVIPLFIFAEYLKKITGLKKKYY